MVERRSALRSVASLILIAMGAGTVVLGAPRVGEAQAVRDLFEKVTPSVVVIRAKGRDVTACGPDALHRDRLRRPHLRRTARS